MKSLINYIMVNEKIRRWVHNARVVKRKIVRSDHQLVIAKMKVAEGWENKKKDIRGEEMRINWQKLREEANRVKYRRELIKVDKETGKMDYGNVIEILWMDSCTDILKIVESVVGMEKMGRRRRGCMVE